MVKWSLAVLALPQRIDALRREDSELRRRLAERSKREADLTEIVEGSLNSIAGRIDIKISQLGKSLEANAQTIEELSQSLLARQMDAQRLDSLEMRIFEIGESLTDSGRRLEEINKNLVVLSEDRVAIGKRFDDIDTEQRKSEKIIEDFKSLEATQKTLHDDIAAVAGEQIELHVSLKQNQEEHQALFDAIDAASGEFGGRIQEIEKFQAEYRSFTKELAAARGEHESLIDHLSSLMEHLQKREEEQSAHLSNLEARVADFRAQQEALETLGPRISALSEQFRRNERHALDKERRLSFLVEEVHELHSDFERKIQARFDGHDPARDSEYVAFTDRFRGTREDVQRRQKIYIPYISALKIDLDKYPVLDAGCGRGEWLELLADAKIKAKGFDANKIMVNSCLEAGLDVEEGGIPGYLEEQKDNTFGALTSFHVVEHLEYNLLLEFLEQSYRVLKKGGMILLETPNPSNMIVGSRDFYIDPTHRNPIPSETLHFLLDARGFRDLEILDVNPFGKELHLTGSKLAGRLNEFFYGPRDYAVIGYKG
jgi:O-antigen chain-terminating methyltransferase